MTNNIFSHEKASQALQSNRRLQNVQSISLENAWRLSFASTPRGSTAPSHSVRLPHRHVSSVLKKQPRKAARLTQHGSNRQALSRASSACTGVSVLQHIDDSTRKLELLNILDCALNIAEELTGMPGTTPGAVTRQSSRMRACRTDSYSQNSSKARLEEDFDLYDHEEEDESAGVERNNMLYNTTHHPEPKEDKQNEPRQ